MKVKKFVIVLLILIVIPMCFTVYAEEIPRESLPPGTTVHSIEITENLIRDVLVDVKNGSGYAEAWNEVNKRILNAVGTNASCGYGYATLAPIARNAIFEYRDIYLRTEYYRVVEEQVRVLISDLIEAVKCGKDYNEAKKEAYNRIIGITNTEFYKTDFCYWNMPAIDYAKFTTARKLLLQAKK